MKYIKKYTVDKDNDKIRIDRWFRRKFNLLPQSFIQNKLRKGKIRLNSKIVKASRKISEGDEIEIREFSLKIYEKNKLKDKPVIPNFYSKKFFSSVLYENNDYLVLNKWTGIATQGGSNIILSVDKIIKSTSNKMNLVHRLDKDTSGTLIITKNYKTTRYFGKLFKDKSIKKIYIAICRGKPNKNSGNINLNINKQGNYKKNKEESKGSITKFELLDHKNNYSLLAFMPITGRTHQIRIVSKYLGCPIIGDKKYNDSYLLKKQSKLKYKNRLMLHSILIGFLYNKKFVTYQADLPEDMNKFLDENKINYPNINNLKKIF